VTDPLDEITERNLRITSLVFAELERRAGDAAALATLTDAKLQTLTGYISKMQRSTSTVLGRVQAIRKDARTAAKRMTLAEKAEAIVEFFAAQPHEIQISLLERLNAALETGPQETLHDPPSAPHPKDDGPLPRRPAQPGPRRRAPRDRG